MVGIVGASNLNSNNLNSIIPEIMELTGQMRFVHVLEQLTVFSVGMALYDAKIPFPVGNSDINLYVGIDDSIEDIKNEYYNNILSEGILGVSPQLFQFTTPNVLAAQATIVFGIRGEAITLPIKKSHNNVIKYATDCISGKYAKMAVAGGITRDPSKINNLESPSYIAEFFILEEKNE
ncbi:MAG: hypothetical protein GY941_29555 [Planctomycetes bacterium]|nr:hypothetical protein [Planctomycetota bacterium]